MITSAQLTKISGGVSEARVSPFVQPLNDAMQEFQINTPLRQAAFIAWVCDESGSFFILREMSPETRYTGRPDMGNIHQGDLLRYRGRGLGQLRGRLIYDLAGDCLGLDLLTHPELLEEHPYSSRSAAWYWTDFLNLNPLADVGDFFKITTRLKGRFWGLGDSLGYYKRVLRILGQES